MIVTAVPPPGEPVRGLTAVTLGAATNVKPSFALVALAPPPSSTVTSTVPAAAAGETAVIDVALVTVKLGAATDPNLTAVAAVKPVPVIVTLVAPEAGPLAGATAVTRATGVNPGASSRKALEDWL